MAPVIVPDVPFSSDDVADHYDELDQWYLEIWGEHLHHGLWTTGRESAEEAAHNLVARIAERLEVKRGDRICDVGCGYGGTARILTREYGASVTGVTVSPAQYAFAMDYRDETIDANFLLMDFLENDFADASFDSVVGIESAEHFFDKQELFSEINRVLRPGGRVAVCGWLAASAPKDWQVRRLLAPMCREGRIPGLGTEEEYRALLEDAGLTDIVFEDYSAQVSRSWRVVLARLAKRLLWDRAAWAFALKNPRGRSLGKTILRILIAYRLGCLRYGLFTARKIEDDEVPAPRRSVK